MSSAWGNSWGKSWGNSWGSIAVAVPAGGIVKYRNYEDEYSRASLLQYQRMRRQRMLEDEDIVAIIIAITQSRLN